MLGCRPEIDDEDQSGENQEARGDERGTRVSHGVRSPSQDVGPDTGVSKRGSDDGDEGHEHQRDAETSSCGAGVRFTVRGHAKTHKQVKFVDYEAERHQGDGRPQPRQEGPFVGEQGADRDPAGHGVIPSLGSMPGRVVLGDGLAVMRSLPEGSFDAIYLDPPFRTGKAREGDRAEFADSWPSLESYLDWLEPFVEESHRLLRPSGWFWLHLDWHSVHYAKVLTDRLFGPRRFRNEIIWHYTGRRTPAARRFNQKHDTILLYARSEASRLTPLAEPWSRDAYVHMKRQQVHRDPDGREWIWGHAGRGRSKAYRIYIDEQVERGRAIDSVWDIPIINTSAAERTGFPTQKPLELLERICRASVPEGGLIGDFLAGSGTTGVAAFNTGRRFFLVDRLDAAVAVAAERLRDRGCPLVPEHFS